MEASPHVCLPPRPPPPCQPENPYHQDGVQVVNHRCPIDSISCGIPSLDSPPPSLKVPPDIRSDEGDGRPPWGRGM